MNETVRNALLTMLGLGILAAMGMKFGNSPGVMAAVIGVLFLVLLVAPDPTRRSR